jgi:hypothetical protein
MICSAVTGDLNLERGTLVEGEYLLEECTGYDMGLQLCLGDLECEITSMNNKIKYTLGRTLRTPSSFVANMMLPRVLSLPVMKAFCPFSWK